MRIDAALITQIATELEPYREDVDAFWDTLDGETDIMELVGKTIEAIVETDAQDDAVSAIIERYQSRRSAIAARKGALMQNLKTILLATGEQKLPHALGTVYTRKGSTSVTITDLEAIPTQLCRITRTPDKAAIKKLLDAGEKIDGAELTTGPDNVSLRMK